MLSFSDLESHKTALAVVGLGYVGLPLATAFAKHFQVIGFDINATRIANLKAGCDLTGEVSHETLQSVQIEYTNDPSQLAKAGFIVIAVPTPIDSHRSPDLVPVISATSLVAKHLSKGSVIVYESTVYPGLTEEICIPLLEKESHLVCGCDFSVGYSPERINPGDKVHTLETIVKIVSGLDLETRELLAKVYGCVVKAGIHKASSIKVAEAAKVIENTQRDLNIALMNELSIIFERLGIDTIEVLEAAGSKWNFLPFRPGLVGGHCIGVDPYYLTFKAEEVGFHPEVILAGRKINDSMGKHIAEITIKRLIMRDNLIRKAKIGILGLTFKENVPDLRNTKVIDVINELRTYGVEILVHDALANPEEALAEYGQKLSKIEDFNNLDALILAVAHDAYKDFAAPTLSSWFSNANKGIVIDVKAFLNATAITATGLDYWRL